MITLVCSVLAWGVVVLLPSFAGLNDLSIRCGRTVRWSNSWAGYLATLVVALAAIALLSKLRDVYEAKATPSRAEPLGLDATRAWATRHQETLAGLDAGYLLVMPRTVEVMNLTTQPIRINAAGRMLTECK